MARRMLHSFALALAWLMSGCVIPIAPDFEDPPPPTNYPLVIISASPPVGSTVTAPAQGNAEFSVTLADPNTGDTLYVRWISDYPKHSDNSRWMDRMTLPPSDALGIERDPVLFEPDCVDHSLAKGLTQHTIMLAAADRPFLNQDQADRDYPWTSIPSGAFVVFGTWLLNLECK